MGIFPRLLISSCADVNLCFFSEEAYCFIKLSQLTIFLSDFWTLHSQISVRSPLNLTHKQVSYRHYFLWLSLLLGVVCMSPGLERGLELSLGFRLLASREDLEVFFCPSFLLEVRHDLGLVFEF